MFALVVRFDCRDQAAVGRFDELTAEVVQQITEKEPGTLVYATHPVDSEPLARVFYELYADRAGFDFHEQQAHTMHFLKEREQYLSGVAVTFLDAQSGKGPMRP